MTLCIQVKEDSQYSAEELEEILAKAEDMTLWESIIFAMSLLSRREICPIKSLHETAAKLKASASVAEFMQVSVSGV